MICGKRIYKTQTEVTDAIIGLRKDKGGARDGKRSPVQATGSYFCNDCNGYHLFTQEKSSNSRYKRLQAVNKHPLFEKKPKQMEYLVIHSKMKIK